jgi:hypothetical protein
MQGDATEDVTGIMYVSGKGMHSRDFCVCMGGRLPAATDDVWGTIC